MQTDALHAFFGRVTPAIPELFNMAYAICGNYDLAEYVLQYTLMETWIGDTHGGMGFREGMRHTLRRVAMDEALEVRETPLEFTWDELGDASNDPILSLLAKENLETRRAVALRDGCGLPMAKVAKLMGLPAGRVREILNRFEHAASGKLPANERRRFESRLAKAMAQVFERADEGMPSLGVIYRSFESDAMETRRPTHLVSKIIKRAIMVVLAVICALVFWLGAVLVQPPQIEDPAAIVTEEGQ